MIKLPNNLFQFLQIQSADAFDVSTFKKMGAVDSESLESDFKKILHDLDPQPQNTSHEDSAVATTPPFEKNQEARGRERSCEDDSKSTPERTVERTRDERSGVNPERRAELTRRERAEESDQDKTEKTEEKDEPEEAQSVTGADIAGILKLIQENFDNITENIKDLIGKLESQQSGSLDGSFKNDLVQLLAKIKDFLKGLDSFMKKAMSDSNSDQLISLVSFKYDSANTDSNTKNAPQEALGKVIQKINENIQNLISKVQGDNSEIPQANLEDLINKIKAIMEKLNAGRKTESTPRQAGEGYAKAVEEMIEAFKGSLGSEETKSPLDILKEELLLAEKKSEGLPVEPLEASLSISNALKTSDSLDARSNEKVDPLTALLKEVTNSAPGKVSETAETQGSDLKNNSQMQKNHDVQVMLNAVQAAEKTADAESAKYVEAQKFSSLLSKYTEVEQSVLTQVTNRARIVLRSDVTRMTVDLQPPELGKINLRIDVEKNMLIGRIRVENTYVKDIIETNLRELKTTLGELGIKIERFDVLVKSDTSSNNDVFSSLSSSFNEQMKNKTQGAPLAEGGSDTAPAYGDEDEKNAISFLEENQGLIRFKDGTIKVNLLG